MLRGVFIPLECVVIGTSIAVIVSLATLAQLTDLTSTPVQFDDLDELKTGIFQVNSQHERHCNYDDGND